MLPDDTSILSLRDANQRFYAAFGSLDMAQMDAVWEQSDRALCVHPGWQPIVGWPEIRRSWQGIFKRRGVDALQHSLRKHRPGR